MCNIEFILIIELMFLIFDLFYIKCLNNKNSKAMTFQDTDYPRRKNFIKHLNILLDSSTTFCCKKSNFITKPLLNKNSYKK